MKTHSKHSPDSILIPVVVVINKAKGSRSIFLCLVFFWNCNFGEDVSAEQTVRINPESFTYSIHRDYLDGMEIEWSALKGESVSITFKKLDDWVPVTLAGASFAVQLRRQPRVFLTISVFGKEKFIDEFNTSSFDFFKSYIKAIHPAVDIVWIDEGWKTPSIGSVPFMEGPYRISEFMLRTYAPGRKSGDEEPLRVVTAQSYVSISGDWRVVLTIHSDDTGNRPSLIPGLKKSIQALLPTFAFEN